MTDRASDWPKSFKGAMAELGIKRMPKGKPSAYGSSGTKTATERVTRRRAVSLSCVVTSVR